MPVSTGVVEVAPALIYSTVPTFDRALVLRGKWATVAEWLELLKPAFQNYRKQFGVCLIHRHFEILSNEVLVSIPVDDPDTIPGITTTTVEVSYPRAWRTIPEDKIFPERWMYRGTPFEFSTEAPKSSNFKGFASTTPRPTAPPNDLQRQFDAAIDTWNDENFSKINLNPVRMEVLGIFFRGKVPPSGSVFLEKTNVTTRTSTIETAPPEKDTTGERLAETCWALNDNNEWINEYQCTPTNHALKDD